MSRTRFTRGLLGSRSKTIRRDLKRTVKDERWLMLDFDVDDYVKPLYRSDCFEGDNAERPCPWVGCKWRLYLDVNPETGSIKLNFPDLQPWELKETCALDVAERGELTLEEVGEITNLTRERIRQLEVIGLIKLKLTKKLNEDED